MLKEHPKGLLGAALSNMGERFGFYTMMAILVLFLQAKFGLSGTHAGIIYSVFYFSIYALAFVGGLIADKSRKYKSTILVGLIIMAIGYVMLGFPTPTPTPNKILFLIISCFGLLTIAFGNGLFKGNLQALVGQMYDNNEYSHKRDAGFSLFYMFINVGALFAPFTAIGIRNWWLARHSYEYDANLPALCHQHVENTLESTKVFGTGVLDQAQGLAEKVFGLDPVSKFQNLATEVGGQTENLTSFANDYLNVFTSGFHYAFIAAIGAMIVSLAIFLFNKKHFPNVDKKVAATAASQDTEIKMDAKEIKQRLYALLAVFGVVIFFWFSFHQNGLTLTMFARDYTDLSGIKINLGFVTIQGAEIFQSINPFFIVFLTPIIMALFGWLRARGKEPSTPKKIAIGMGIAAAAYVVMVIGSYDLPLYKDIQSSPLDNSLKVTPLLLIGTYFILTVAELFISPLGISFVSKVAPPHLQGLMQGGWLGATALGNQLLFIGAILYENTPLWLTWTVFVVACLLSMITMLAMLKWLEKITE
ncbi:MAG: peptide MFS transporter [Bacteroidales bacterium]|jgi:POT family proton-dependent oligopeptide transporter|nr:peptide MFS transporter [Bacteroidales bacterium]MDI9591724.1 peptide MFS transporter [Bacteroidota bacterium]NLH33626.1 peptide MFS transporter [Lentimicrobium sp.]MBP7873380.1 peptide MFS transporter [Bacteroidales bacterium]MCO6467695.1 peptide MFS transporter [Bacteroidales bacterium]